MYFVVREPQSFESVGGGHDGQGIWVLGGPTTSSPSNRAPGDAHPWMSPRPSGAVERLAYGLVALVLLGIALVCGVAVLSALPSLALGFIAFFGVLGVLTLVLGVRMLTAAILGRRLFWWPGQREYDRQNR